MVATVPPTPPRAAFPLVAVLLLAATKLIIHLLVGGRYGYHRDELYYLAGGDHLAWGYVDHPPLTPFLARLVGDVFGNSLFWLRLLPAVAGTVIVVLAALLAREFGGRTWSPVLAAFAVLVAPIFLAANALFQTVSFDQLWWVVALLLVVKLLKGADQRLWLALGIVFGVGLETKQTILLLAGGLAVGLLSAPTRAWFRAPWPWLGGAIALLIWAPNLAWQATNNWPSVEFSRNNNAAWRQETNLFESFIGQITLVGPFGLALWIAGWWFLWQAREGRYRPLAVAYAVIAAAMLAINAKYYYLGPFYPVLLAAGAVAAERWFATATAARRRVVVGVAALAAIGTLPIVPLLMPALPVQTAKDTGYLEASDDLSEQIGWPELAEAVAAVHATLPEPERATAAILTGNYGQAGAIDRYGPALDLPSAASAHNSYALWGPGRLVTADAVIVLGLSESTRVDLFDRCDLAATSRNRLGVDNEEQGRPIYVCHALRMPVGAAWERLTHYD
ncbi:MAG: hypothetical protein AVDCRST_MAG73-4024 [uncultured Thermomicrobiales bacterium]|uniref:Glycosyltransferase RgtA/B/C/D-like domain-containing protein n=1 Tax=uncultured Thermomicrobiales bacterium TaxID=1645740 RepID=A0A6J4V1X6_9BACT|nr:MAG: hypothetical protein AVDCRST_MAG73-4024 [uncultured Thermomicrobiales bacterium]